MDYRKNIKALQFDDIRKILDETDTRVVFEKTNIIPDEKDLYDRLVDYVDYSDIGKKSVLGIDIFKYSSFGSFEQTLIPFLFKAIFNLTLKQCFTNHKYLFQKTSEEEINRTFISTGDGGYLIFDTPLHSLVFAINFAVVIRVYNAFHLYPKLRKIIGAINLRYAITYDRIYIFDNNFYGRAIINCARILMKDDLNRCLIDEHSHSWFTTNMEGIENLQILTIQELSNIYDLRDYDHSVLDLHPDEIFESEVSRRYGIINADILKIGKISSKDTELSIYNLHLQVTLNLINDDDPLQKKTVTISLGNLNTSGI